MSEELPVLGGTPFKGLLTHGQLGQGQDKFRTFVERIHYKVVGCLTAALDYVLIVTASIVPESPLFNHPSSGCSNLMAYVGAANIVAALFILGGASRGSYTPSAIVSASRQYDPSCCFGRWRF